MLSSYWASPSARRARRRANRSVNVPLAVRAALGSKVNVHEMFVGFRKDQLKGPTSTRSSAKRFVLTPAVRLNVKRTRSSTYTVAVVATPVKRIWRRSMAAESPPPMVKGARSKKIRVQPEDRVVRFESHGLPPKPFS